jgi:hypothetical protein
VGASAPQNKRLRREAVSNIKTNEELAAFETKKLEILDKKEAAETDDDLLHLKSLLPHIKSLPRMRIIHLCLKFQELIIQELEEMENSARLSVQ